MFVVAGSVEKVCVPPLLDVSDSDRALLFELRSGILTAKTGSPLLEARLNVFVSRSISEIHLWC